MTELLNIIFDEFCLFSLGYRMSSVGVLIVESLKHVLLTITKSDIPNILSTATCFVKGSVLVDNAF